MIDVKITAPGVESSCTLTHGEARATATMLLSMDIPLYSSIARDGIALLATTLELATERRKDVIPGSVKPVKEKEVPICDCGRNCQPQNESEERPGIDESTGLAIEDCVPSDRFGSAMVDCPTCKPIVLGRIR